METRNGSATLAKTVIHLKFLIGHMFLPINYQSRGDNNHFTNVYDRHFSIFSKGE